MRIALVLLCLGLFAPAGWSDDRAEVDYLRDIKPLLVEKCFSCHGAWKQKGKLRLDTIALMKAGGRAGPAVAAGDPENSWLLLRTRNDEAGRLMPPEGEGERLTPEQLGLVKRWIDQGATGPHEDPQPDPRDHWAFQPVERPPVPTSDVAGFKVKTPVDAFLASRWQAAGLTPVRPADRRTLLRRVTFDLTGLPPTVGELDRFLADDSPTAYEDAVDRLLASPRYGERWGRHWLDVWRYSDWSGENNNQVRGSPQHIWRWRDWVVDRLNADAGYDRMLTEMLAGDELAPNDPDVLRATGFLARNEYKFNRNVWLDDAVEHTARAFLGLSFGCAKCHDHKFDPVAIEDYYRLRAVFEPHRVRTDRAAGLAFPKDARLVRVVDREPDTPTFVFHRGNEKEPITDNPLSPDVPTGVLGGEYEPGPVRVGNPVAVAAVVGSSVAEVESAFSTGRRLELTRWLTDPRNSLTARVAVNHMWVRHFGTPLVTVDDFGLRSPKPRHAELLDWLAAELVANGWRTKPLHRRIVTSSAYRLRSDHRDNPAANSAVDPENLDYWRMNSQRLEAEAIRDAVLAAAGTLDATMGGPEIPLEDGETSRRRGIYFRHAHERKVPFLDQFDSANPLECYRRTVTVVPQQSLALFNSPLVLDQARTLAGKVSDGAGDSDVAFVSSAFEHTLGRPPTTGERRASLAFLADQTKRLADPNALTVVPGGPESQTPAPASARDRARSGLVHVLFNHTEFITVR